MEGRVNYTVVGAFVVAITAILLFGIFWLTSIGHGKLYHTYLVYVHEDVTGLSVESPVRFNGVKIGYVQAIKLDDKNPRLVKLVLSIEPTVPITTSTYAILNEQGVTGVVYVNLKAATESAQPLLAQPGQPYPVIPSRPSLLMQLSAVLPEVTQDIQKLSASIAQVLDTDNRDAIKKSLKNMQQITTTLADNSTEFTDTIQSLNNTMSNVSELSNHFPQTLVQLNKTLTSINQLSADMAKTSKNISATMETGQVAIHSFSNEVLPNAQEALNSLSLATQSAQRLTSELQRDPSMLIRGKIPAPSGPGEK